MDLVLPEIVLYDKIKIKKEYIPNVNDLQQFIYRLDESFISTVTEDDDFYYVGIGCLDRIKADRVIDQRVSHKLNSKITFKAKLHEAQQRTANRFLDENGEFASGIVKAKCGWGKSFMGTKLICDANDPTIVLVHTKLLLDQWLELFKSCTDYEPGIIGDGIYQPKDVTIGLYISVNNKIPEIKNRFSRVIVDEVHRCGAELFSDTLNRLPARYKMGMSATPTRRDGKHILFPDYFTGKFVEAEEYRNLIRPFVEIKKVPFKFEALNPTTDWARALTKVFSNQVYLDMLVEDIKELALDGRRILVLGPRVEALEYLESKVPRSKTLIGKTKNRQAILDSVGKDIDVIFTTTLFDEGVSCHIIDTLITTAPNGKNYGLLEQRIGRIQREHPDKQPVLMRAYWLQNHILAKQQNIEYMWYNAQGYQTRLI